MWVLAGSCFPNCHPAGQTYDTLNQSGNVGLGAAVVLLLVLVLMSRRSRG